MFNRNIWHCQHSPWRPEKMPQASKAILTGFVQMAPLASPGKHAHWENKNLSFMSVAACALTARLFHKYSYSKPVACREDILLSEALLAASSRLFRPRDLAIKNETRHYWPRYGSCRSKIIFPRLFKSWAARVVGVFVRGEEGDLSAGGKPGPHYLPALCGAESHLPCNARVDHWRFDLFAQSITPPLLEQTACLEAYGLFAGLEC